jgi:hypothetical protein
LIPPVAPDYASGSLADLLPAVAVGLGVSGFAPRVEIEPADRVVVLLVDGLGARALAEYSRFAPCLAQLRSQPLVTGFPSTTAVGLGSLGTGTQPGTHGLVGTLFVVPEWGGMLAPLRWTDEPNPIATAPDRTVFERVAAQGVTVSTVGPAKFAASGLTRAVLRGANYVAAESVDELVARTSSLVRAGGRSLTYVYWAELDKLGHVYGLGTDKWVAGLRIVDDLVARLLAALPSDARLHVTSDHGMVDCGTADVIDIDADQVLTRDVLRIGGEPRARHLYVRPGAASDVIAAWRGRIGDRAWINDRAEAISLGWFGAVDVELADRIGDVVVAATGTNMLASAATDPRLSRLRGQHGSLSLAELEIPLLTGGG